MYTYRRKTGQKNPSVTHRRPSAMALMRACLAFLTGAMAIVALAPASAGEEVDLVPHRAVYEMTLSTTGDGNADASGKGRMVYEFRGAECLGYSVSMRWVAEWADGEGGVSVEDLRYASFEDGEGDSFTFTSTRYRDRDLIEEMQASAKLGKGDMPGTVERTKPESASAELPPGTIFPTTHMRAVIGRALAGKTAATDQIYDVSESGTSVYNTFTIVSPLSEKEQARSIESAPRLKGLPAWSATVSYFLGDQEGEAIPEYEQTFSLFANGIATRMRLGTANVMIDAELSQLEFLKPSSC